MTPLMPNVPKININHMLPAALQRSVKKPVSKVTLRKLEKSQLAELFETSLATLSPITQRYESKLTGDAVELNQSVSFALIKSIHSYFRDVIFKKYE